MAKAEARKALDLHRNSMKPTWKEIVHASANVVLNVKNGKAMSLGQHRQRQMNPRNKTVNRELASSRRH